MTVGDGQQRQISVLLLKKISKTTQPFPMSADYSNTLDRLREELTSLESFGLPEKFQSSKENANASLVQQYKEARDDYVRRKVNKTFLSHVQTFDGKSFEMPVVPSEEEQAALKERREQVLLQVQQAAQDIRKKMVELQAKHCSFVARKEELEQMIEEMEASGHSMEIEQDGSGEDMEDVEDEELAAQQERLVALQQRKAELLAQLDAVQEETMQSKKITKEKSAQLQNLKVQHNSVHEPSEESIAAVQAENAKMQSQLSHYQEIQAFYEGLRLIMEEVGGIRILAVDKAPQEANEDLKLTVQVLNGYDIEIGLKQKKETNNKASRQEDNLRVVHAKFLTDTTIQGPTLDDKDGITSSIQMQIPALDDLVRLSDNMASGNDLRFVLREAMARITTIQTRVRELTLLQQEASTTKVGKFYHYSNGFGGEDQDIVCNLNEHIAVVLRLTPDCPMVKGSVYIDQLVGLDDWGAEAVEQVKRSINGQLFKSPVDLVRTVKAEIQRRYEQP